MLWIGWTFIEVILGFLLVGAEFLLKIIFWPFTLLGCLFNIGGARSRRSTYWQSNVKVKKRPSSSHSRPRQHYPKSTADSITVNSRVNDNRYAWRLNCEDGSAYGISPDSFETKAEYNVALRHAKEELMDPIEVAEDHFDNHPEDLDIEDMFWLDEIMGDD